MSRPTIPPQDAVLTAAPGGRGVSSLSHPLPSGMRDLLPAEAEAQGVLGERVLRTFELHGYQQVVLPAFEYADVLEQGLGMIEPTSMLRFVEPETGEVVALRPDMTPQVARLVSTRLSGFPSPTRLSYKGSVLRRQHERARHDQQVLQAGVELVGVAGTEADLEVITVCAQAVREAGLTSFVLDLGHGGIAGALLSGLTASSRADLLECLSLKDGAELSRRAQSQGLPSEQADALLSLLELQGGPEVFELARAPLETTKAWPLILELEALYEAVQLSGVAPKIVVDLGETRGAAYYTGPTFQILAEGPGQAVASGGRYDSLYGMFGAERPAAGGAIQLDHLRWALGGVLTVATKRVVVLSPVLSEGAGSKNEASTDGVLKTLRSAGIPCVHLRSSDAEGETYARAWRYSHVLRLATAKESKTAQAKDSLGWILRHVQSAGLSPGQALESDQLVDAVNS